MDIRSVAVTSELFLHKIIDLIKTFNILLARNYA